jgi:L-asparaginase II
MTLILVITVMSTVFLVIGLATMHLLKLYKLQAARVAALQNQLSALCEGAAGTDERILRFEQTLAQIRHHQHAIDLSANSQPAHDHAIRLARKGASVSQLIDNCNLSDEEAHLISRLHGKVDTRPEVH